MVLVAGETHEQHAQRTAKQILAPETAAFRVISAAEGNTVFGAAIDAGGVLEHMRNVQAAVNAGDLAAAEAMLIAQATSLQTLSVRLIERGLAQPSAPHLETFIRLGLKAQAQSRLAIEALGTLKHGPAILARNAQVNVAHGPQQVNNGVSPPRAGDSGNPPIQLSSSHELRADTGASGGAGCADQDLAPVGAIDRPQDRRGQGALGDARVQGRRARRSTRPRAGAAAASEAARDDADA
jgi:hypothetical protein